METNNTETIDLDFIKNLFAQEGVKTSFGKLRTNIRKLAEKNFMDSYNSPMVS